MSPDASKDYFAVLGLSPHADPDVVKAAYRALAKKYHPDRQPDGETAVRDKFHELQEAYELLRDDQQRRHYISLRERAEQRHKEAAARHARPVMLLRLDDRWEHLVREFPDTARAHARFCMISPRLGQQFKLTILGTGNPASFARIAARMERRFYRQHFSYHRDLHTLARKLAHRRRRHALRELSREIKGRRLLPTRYRRDLLARYETRYLQRPGPAPAHDGRCRLSCACRTRRCPGRASGLVPPPLAQGLRAGGSGWRHGSAPASPSSPGRWCWQGSCWNRRCRLRATMPVPAFRGS